MFACPEAAPGPVLGPFDQAGRQGVALDVAADLQEVLVALDREALEAALVEVAEADGVVGDAPAHGVGVGEPAEEGGELRRLGRPDDEVPVVAHHAPGQDTDGVTLVRPRG